MSILISDPYNIQTDLSMGFLQDALSKAKIEDLFRRHLPELVEGFELDSIEVIRHKPGKRCLIQYNFKNQEETISLMGKVTAKGTDFNSCQLQDKLWHGEFRDNSIDGISVPQPVGIIPELRMWIQRKVLGTMATQWLATPQGVPLVKKIAMAAYKLHQSDLPTHRRHTIEDELKILHQRLPLVIQLYPHWQLRITRILEQCDRLGATFPSVQQKGIHRDFYPEQIIFNGERLFILDFDLYCQGDLGLDIGNFIAHITEYSLRNLGDADALKELEIAMIEQFVELAGEETRFAIAVYSILTLVRHIYLSTQFSERRPFTVPLLNLCEQRLYN